MDNLIEPRYSIAIMPPKSGIDYVNELKNSLCTAINWFNSKNSKAHVTISEFVADDDEIEKIINQLKDLSSYEKPFHVNFEGVSSYKNGAVFITPDGNSKIALKQLMLNIQKGLKIKNVNHSKDPHMSIGRKLSEDNVATALKMFADVKLNFDCVGLVLRKFNPDIKVRQYEVLNHDFKFLGNEPKPNLQQSLF
ncbi:2'-5' RNA ligase family protein [Pedobacter boryungensis]|uniref:2'-5' RNA ligase family protein n=2 Tax=Pedobacter boryungensis TaxID=869962 RepID=A0ABX2DBG9_9SPHI|nr:2'-5' RNA ligase family protein [Pedobacter boryungensis]